MTKKDAEVLRLCLTCASYFCGNQFCGYGNITQRAEQRHLCALTEEQILRRRMEWETDKSGKFTGKPGSGR